MDIWLAPNSTTQSQTRGRRPGAWQRRGFGTVPRCCPPGKVHVAGPSDRGGGLASAEIYDPILNSWSPAGSLAVGRVQPAAARLPNGRIPVAGGSALASAEVCDPVANSWAFGGQHGGRAQFADDDGATDRERPRRREGSTAAISRAPSYPTRGGHLDIGRPMTAVTRESHCNFVAQRQRARRWRGKFPRRSRQRRALRPSLPTPGLRRAAWPAKRSDHPATLLPNGKVLATEGFNFLGPWISAELYDPVADRAWSSTQRRVWQAE